MRKLFQLLGLINDEQAQPPVKNGVEHVAFKNGNNTEHRNALDQNEQPEEDLQIDFQNLDEEFAYNFTREGGKFMFCLSKKSLYLSLNQVLADQKWDKVYVNESEITEILKDNNEIEPVDIHKNADVYISTCDNLVAFNGRIMVSSNQCKGLNFSELPVNHIIIANHSQIVKNLGEGLRRINAKYFKNLPSKITTLKNKNTNRNSGTSKNIYVFLLEDY